MCLKRFYYVIKLVYKYRMLLLFQEPDKLNTNDPGPF